MHVEALIGRCRNAKEWGLTATATCYAGGAYPLEQPGDMQVQCCLVEGGSNTIAATDM